MAPIYRYTPTHVPVSRNTQYLTAGGACMQQPAARPKLAAFFHAAGMLACYLTGGRAGGFADWGVSTLAQTRRRLRRCAWSWKSRSC
jgi:hypothetical protein